MKICKQLKKAKVQLDQDSSYIRYYIISFDNAIDHNPYGPALIYLDANNNITSLYFKEMGVSKNRKKGPVYLYFVGFGMEAEAKWWSLNGNGACIKYYYEDFSIKKIITFMSYDLSNYDRSIKSKRIYKKGVHFDNMRKELEKAKKWV